MRSILLSFEPEWFDYIETGKKKYEYRSNFPDGDKTLVYFYVSAPVKAICGMAVMGEREPLSAWLKKYESQSVDVINRIRDFMTDCRYAIPIMSFTPTNRIALETLRNDLQRYIVPRMYYFIDDSELEQYLRANLRPTGDTLKHDFGSILDDDIC